MHSGLGVWPVRGGLCGAGVCVAFLWLGGLAGPARAVETNTRLDGYHGIWFTIGQDNEWGPKYSGGLGTYTANHVPIAIYAPEVDKTFFVYGGVDPVSGDLLIMASFYDHAACRVPRPVVVYHKTGINDPHDNAALLIDREGYLWVFISGRGRARPGFIYRSAAPYSIDAWEHKVTDERTYPQPWYLDDGAGPPLFLHMFTKYTAGRELYWATSPDGVHWSPHRKMVGFRGHYQTTCERNGKIITAFNYHPDGSVDRRTNLYYMQTVDGGQTWTTADGAPLALPLNQAANPALLVNYEAQGRLCYINDTNLDDQGRPYILYITSSNYAAGPAGDPRVWHLARWTGQQWVYSDITVSDHNYDVGSLYIEGNTLRIIAPTENGPQVYGTGGEVAMWISHDLGATWTRVRQITTGSRYNHSYVRRPRNARDPFYAFWADGDALRKSPSRLYFCNRAGTHVWRLPVAMTGEWGRPERVTDFGDTSTPADPLWRSRFERFSAGPVAHGQALSSVRNVMGAAGIVAGQTPLSYAAYGQPGVGPAPVAGAGSFAASLPNDRSVAINTTLPSDAGNLQNALTFEGFFRTPAGAPISSPTYVGRRLVTQKRSHGDGESRLAIGLHGASLPGVGSANALSVFWHDTEGENHLESGVTPIQPDRWYHFALAYDGTDLKWYLDGHLEGQVAVPNLVPAGPGLLSIANNRLSGVQDRGFYGLLDEIRIVDQALSPDEFLLNGGSCETLCGSAASGPVLWCSGFEADAGMAVDHGLNDNGLCGSIENLHGVHGSAAGALPLTYAAYGQPGVGQPPASAVGGFALSWPDDRSAAIHTHLPSNAGQLQDRLTFEGFFNSAETGLVTAPSSVARRLVTQKGSALDSESRLAVGLHASGGQNVLAVFWRGADMRTHTELGTTPILPHVWYHFALVYDGDLRWYLNGRLEGTVAAPALAGAGPAPIAIGNGRVAGVADRGFYGLLDEIRIFDRPLSPDEFLQPPPAGSTEPCYPACPFPFADTDGDADVDQSDFGRFQACLTGRGDSPQLPPPECICFDRDGNEAVDDEDLAAFLHCVSGPSVAWDLQPDPGCSP